MKRVFEKSVEWTIILLFGSFTVVMLMQVVSRYVFNYSFIWSDEFTRYTFIWMVLLASGVAIRRKVHLGFDLFVAKLPKKLQVIVNIVNDLLIAVFLVFFFFKSIELLRSAGMTPSPSMHIPMGVVYIILPLSALVMLIYLLESLYRTIRYGDTHEAAEDAPGKGGVA
mgnify:CR=1 FL=1